MYPEAYQHQLPVYHTIVPPSGSLMFTDHPIVTNLNAWLNVYLISCKGLCILTGDLNCPGIDWNSFNAPRDGMQNKFLKLQPYLLALISWLKNRQKVIIFQMSSLAMSRSQLAIYQLFNRLVTATTAKPTSPCLFTKVAPRMAIATQLVIYTMIGIMQMSKLFLNI